MLFAIRISLHSVKRDEGDLVALASLQSADQSQHRARRCLASIEENGRGSDQDLHVSTAG